MADGLQGKVALVTGAGRGIGRAVAVALAQAGADVAVNFRAREDMARDSCLEIEGCGRRTVCVRADVSLASEVFRLVRLVEQELGTIDILVNNAGIARPRNADNITAQDWDETLAHNLKSAFLVTQAVLPGMRGRRWGRIINLSSLAAQAGGVVGPHYAASKAGIIGLTHYYASKLAREGICVNSIAPAIIETDMITSDLQISAGSVPVPAGRLGTVEEVARIAVMLAGNGFVTGQTINVNGGLYMS